MIDTSIQPSDLLREKFVKAMSEMYRNEVPKYGNLVDMVGAINQQELLNAPELENSLRQTNNLERLAEERHGAIRLGKAEELFNIRRLFAILGMHPVGYYDLAVAGIPVHSTAFRPIEASALSSNAFRVFTSLLRIDLIEDESLRKSAESVLNSRNIFSPTLMDMIDDAEKKGGISCQQTEYFIQLAVDVFRWHDEALVDAELYQKLHDSHRLIADVVSFKGPHINHLTPATLDIDRAQAMMPEQNMTPKAVIEGPPRRNCPILLRQTSFKALEEPVKFPDQKGQYQAGSHTARFGEIEQRGIALTHKGQALYERLLNKAREEVTPHPDGSNASEYATALEKAFADFPDSHSELRKQELAFFHYSICDQGALKQGASQGRSIDQLIEADLVRYDPIIYEDFLPVSAAGIFQSNLGDNSNKKLGATSNQELFESQLGTRVTNYFKLYEAQQQASIESCLAAFQ